jgi:hypothetical protein
MILEDAWRASSARKRIDALQKIDNPPNDLIVVMNNHLDQIEYFDDLFQYFQYLQWA